MPVCPHCHAQEKQVKAGVYAGKQRYRCGVCQRRYTPALGERGYTEAVRERAALLRAQGMTIRQIARELGANHQSVANWLRRREEGEPAPEPPPPPVTPPTVSRRPTIDDVARRAGVSPSSVSNFLNQKGRMSEATRGRIQGAIEALRFTPSALVQAIRHHRTRILGVLIFGVDRLDEVSGPVLTPALLRGFHDGAAAAGNDLLVYTGWPHRSQDELGSRFLDGHIDGLLWVSPKLSSPALERVVAAGLPTVSILARRVPPGAGCVHADNFEAMETLIGHLADRGHRRIVYIVGPADHFSDFADRREGYRRGLAARRLPWDPSLECTIPLFQETEFASVIEAWLARADPPTAIMCSSDYQAARVARVLQERGIRIPEDIALTGFDDMPIATDVAGGLTTVRQPFQRMGRLAAQGLLDMIAGAPPYREKVPAELFPRASTGPALMAANLPGGVSIGGEFVGL